MFQENSIKTCILSRVKQITSPGWMHETSAQGWCTGKTQRDAVGRVAGGGIGMGNTCKSMLIHVNVWQKLHLSLFLSHTQTSVKFRRHTLCYRKVEK